MAEGDIGSIIDTLVFESTLCHWPDLIHIAGDVYAIAYQGPDSDGFVVTMTITDAGQIGAAVIDTLEFDTVNGLNPVIIHVAGSVYAIAYAGDGSDGWVCTFTIETNGQIGAAVIDTLEFDTAQGMNPDIINVGSGVFAVVYSGYLNDGFVKTFGIDVAGNIDAAPIDSLEFDTADCISPKIRHVYSNIYAACYRGTTNYGKFVTFSITSGGQIGAAVIDTLTFDTGGCYDPDFIKIADNIFCAAYANGSTHGTLTTARIEDDGQIGAAIIDTFAFETSNGAHNNIKHVSTNVYAVAFNGPATDGFVKTMTVEDDGQIGAGLIDTFEFDTDNAFEPCMLHIAGSVYAISYRGPSDTGKLITLDIETTPDVIPRHELLMGIG